MPKFPHELLVNMFRQRPELARALLSACAGIKLAGGSTEIGSIDLSQVAPPTYYADSVVVVYNASRVATGAVIVEIQTEEDDDKRRSWPVYVTVLRARLNCPVYLLAVVPNAKVARWARKTIDLGHPGFNLRPIVIKHRDVPRITDPAAAARLPELAVLSAIAHPSEAVATAALHAIRNLPRNDEALYWDVIVSALPAALAQKILERYMKGYEYQTEFARSYYAKGREVGHKEGREQGLQQLRTAAIESARAKLDTLSSEETARISAVMDDATLTELIIALARAHSSVEARLALDRLAPDHA